MECVCGCASSRFISRPPASDGRCCEAGAVGGYEGVWEGSGEDGDGVGLSGCCRHFSVGLQWTQPRVRHRSFRSAGELHTVH